MLRIYNLLKQKGEDFIANDHIAFRIFDLPHINYTNKAVVKFKQGDFSVLNSYYEFARRYPMTDGELYQGGYCELSG